MDIEKIEAEYKKVCDKPAAEQLVAMRAYLEKQGLLNDACLDNLIGKMENQVSRRSFNYSIEMGLSYPAIVLIITIAIAVISIVSPENLTWFSVLISLAAVAMLVTAILLRRKSYIYDLVDLLYDVKSSLINNNIKARQ